jgi:hypothetical protein
MLPPDKNVPIKSSSANRRYSYTIPLFVWLPVAPDKIFESAKSGLLWQFIMKNTL